MSKEEHYFVVLDNLHALEYNVSLGRFLAVCIERLRQKGYTPRSAMAILHDHLERASTWDAPHKE
ncbi:hypothetical protein ES703_121879 [subsurface metagenome]